jgi:hypothetical protein
MRSQGVLTGQGFSISDNDISLLIQETNTCDEIQDTNNFVHGSRTIGNFLSSTVNLNQFVITYTQPRLVISVML